MERYGQLSEKKDNVILIGHALTGDAHAAGYHSKKDKKPGWWDLMIGPGKGIDTNKYHVICSNVLGGCKGTTGPSSINPKTKKPYGANFPLITIGDMIEVQKRLLDELKIPELYGVIGGSAGGSQVMEWCIKYPSFIKNAICIASAESFSAQALSFDIVARNMIMADPSWNQGNYYNKKNPDRGLSLARMIGHITYLSKESMDKKFGRARRSDTGKSKFSTDFQIESYLNYQGSTFVDRFDANSFLYITYALDSFSFHERGKTLQEVYNKFQSKFLIVSVSSDWLYPIEQSKELAENLLRAGKDVTYCNLDVAHGHDAFLLENPDLSKMISSFFSKKSNNKLKIDESNQSVLADYREISQMLKSGKKSNLKILDLGCGDGTFLKQVLADHNIEGHGFDIDFQNIVQCTKKDVPAFQINLDEGLGMLPNKYYDFAILSRTLLEVRKPDLVLTEMLRVAKTCIVSFPNFANWRHRLRLGISGKLPMSKQFPYHWYDTPNVHFVSIKDFKLYCKKRNIKILKLIHVAESFISKLLLLFGRKNLGTDHIIIKFTKK
jgi:homoserine O-acetyltransferase